MIARRFNAGISPQTNPVPRGRLKTKGRSGRPFGTCARLGTGPNIETLGYSHASLRDRRPVFLIA